MYKTSLLTLLKMINVIIFKITGHNTARVRTSLTRKSGYKNSIPHKVKRRKKNSLVRGRNCVSHCCLYFVGDAKCNWRYPGSVGTGSSEGTDGRQRGTHAYGYRADDVVVNSWFGASGSRARPESTNRRVNLRATEETSNCVLDAFKWWSVLY